MSSKLTIKMPKCPWRRSSVFIANFEYIPHLFPVFILLNFNRHVCSVCSVKQTFSFIPNGPLEKLMN